MGTKNEPWSTPHEIFKSYNITLFHRAVKVKWRVRVIMHLLPAETADINIRNGMWEGKGGKIQDLKKAGGKGSCGWEKKWCDHG